MWRLSSSVVGVSYQTPLVDGCGVFIAVLRAWQIIRVDTGRRSVHSTRERRRKREE